MRIWRAGKMTDRKYSAESGLFATTGCNARGGGGTVALSVGNVEAGHAAMSTVLICSIKAVSSIFQIVCLIPSSAVTSAIELFSCHSRSNVRLRRCLDERVTRGQSGHSVPRPGRQIILLDVRTRKFVFANAVGVISCNRSGLAIKAVCMCVP